MKRFYIRLFVGFIALFLGVLSVFLISLNNFQRENTQNSIDSTEKINIQSDSLNIESKIIKFEDEQKFKLVDKFGGMANSYGSLYDSIDGERLSTGIDCWEMTSETQRNFRQELSLAKRIIQNSKIKDKSNKSLRRIVFDASDETGKYFSILKYDDGKCYSEITGHSLKNLFEFENWLAKQKPE